MEDFIDKHLATIITALIGVSAWLFERKRKKAEVQQIEGDTTARMQGIYGNLVKDIEKQFIELRAKVEALELKVIESDYKVKILEEEVIEWKEKYRVLKEELNSYENGINKTSSSGKK